MDFCWCKHSYCLNLLIKDDLLISHKAYPVEEFLASDLHMLIIKKDTSHWTKSTTHTIQDTSLTLKIFLSGQCNSTVEKEKM